MTDNEDLAVLGAATSRSSAKRVASVVSKFSNEKKKLVCDIGFGGILHMPQINMTPRKFTVWLLSKLHVDSRSIVVNGRDPILLHDKAFERVLGIPCGPRKLFGLDFTVAQDKTDFILHALGSVSTDPSETCSVKVAEQIVTMDYPKGMSKVECERFKVSFVVFVVGHFLTAKARSNHGMDDYWGSLMKTDEIHLYNYCTLVIDELVDSAKRVQNELRANRPVKNVTGCTLGLQVLYLDSLKIDGFNLKPEILPRIAVFDLVLLKRMIHVDESNNISYFNVPEASSHGCSKDISHILAFGNSKSCDSANDQIELKSKASFYSTPQPAVSTYLTAYLRGSIEKKLTNSQVDDLKWHNARMIQHVRKTKSLLLEGGGFSMNEAGFKTIVEVNMEALMAHIFQDNLSLAQRLHKHCSPYENTTSTTNKVSSWESHSSSFYYHGSESRTAGTFHSSVGGGSNSEGAQNSLASTSITPLIGKELFKDSTPYTNVTSNKKIKLAKHVEKTEEIVQSGKAAHKYEPFFLPEDAITAIAENASCSSKNLQCNQKHNYAVSRLICRQKRRAPNPWKYSNKWKSVECSMTSGFYIWVQQNNLSTLRCNWIEHALPKYIELNGYDLKSVFVQQKGFTKEAFDVAVRRISQLDFQMYGAGRKICWRHIFESDFADMMLSGLDPLGSISVILQFTLCFNEYDISECRMLVIPALLDEVWCAYFWDMEGIMVHVIDPTYDVLNESGSQEIHNLNIDKMRRSLSCLQKVLYEGWNVDWSAFKPNFMEPLTASCNRSDSGILTLLSIQEFDGSRFVESQTKESVASFYKLVLYEMMAIEGNYGKVPSAYIPCVN